MRRQTVRETVSDQAERISVVVTTRDRPVYLSATISSLLAQTIVQDIDLHVVDGSLPAVLGNSYPVPEVPECISRLMGVFTAYGGRFFYHPVPGDAGIPKAYQRGHTESKTELVYRTEDDVFLEPECLERLRTSLANAGDKVAAIAPMTPNYNEPRSIHHVVDGNLRNGFQIGTLPDLPEFGSIGLNPFDDQSKWCLPGPVYDVCHIHGGCLYRKSVLDQVCGGWAVEYTRTGHREETVIYVRLHFAGWRLLVDSSARLVHFESNKGGSRPMGRDHESRLKDRKSDEQRFQRELQKLILCNPQVDLPIYDRNKRLSRDEVVRRIQNSTGATLVAT